MTLDLDAFDHAAIRDSVARGLSAFGVPEPMSLDEWAAKHFYLSAESSYIEQPWRAWPFQRAIMCCISNDAIEQIDWPKAARVGNTKIMLAAIGFFAEHKRRNQAMWQPTDDDRDEFVKTELNPMLRDVVAMRRVFPSYLARHKDNTLNQKKFIGSMLHLRGGKAAKNYRRISIDVAYVDESDAFDNNVESEGDPVTLVRKRIEGATFPKLIVGSTPKLKGLSIVETQADRADVRLRFVIPCPHCGKPHPITWGGKDEPHGFKWQGRDPATVRHLCPHHGCLITQGEYLGAWESGYYQSIDGTLTLDGAGVFRNADGDIAPAPRHVAFVDVWTAYSPAASWSQIVADFMSAYEKAEHGDTSLLQAFWNTTLARSWEVEVETTDAEGLYHRAEDFPLSRMPRDCLLLLCGCDTQDNRIEIMVWGYGRGARMWTIQHHVIYGNPAEEEIWRELEHYLFETRFEHASGVPQKIYAAAIDSGGHHADAVYAFAHKHRARRVHAVKGSSGRERSIDNGNVRVAFDWRGRREQHGPVLWHVGTNLAKDRLHSRLDITKPGPGYVHMSKDLPDEWFRQVAGEGRTTVRGQRGTETRWVATRKRLEARDCTVYTIFLEERLDLWSTKSQRWWEELEQSVQAEVASGRLESVPQPAQFVRPAKPRPRSSPFGSSDWSSRL